MNILLIGSGGREHALAWKMAASPLLTKLWCAPGNAGIAQDAECVALDVADHAAVVAFCKVNKVDLVMVGPEAPLAAGIVDDLAEAGIKAFGPSKAASPAGMSRAPLVNQIIPIASCTAPNRNSRPTSFTATGSGARMTNPTAMMMVQARHIAGVMRIEW